ncbi:MAG: type II toxin-antitoxin system VapC family toxin [Nitrospiraceae bacterium]
MMLYLDTSALVKLYVDEPMAQAVKAAVGETDAVATSLLAYVEARAAFARARRESRLSLSAYRRVVDAFVEDWSRYITVEVTDALVKEAGQLAASRSLRGYDALHLAAALSLQHRITMPLYFLAFDRQLMAAAKREGLPHHSIIH